MKPRHPNLEWMKKILADLECDRGNPQIAALMDGRGDLLATAAEPVAGVKPAQEPSENSSSRPRH